MKGVECFFLVFEHWVGGRVPRTDTPPDVVWKVALAGWLAGWCRRGRLLQSTASELHIRGMIIIIALRFLEAFFRTQILLIMSIFEGAWA